jgi:hypothetical protein
MRYFDATRTAKQQPKDSGQMSEEQMETMFVDGRVGKLVKYLRLRTRIKSKILQRKYPMPM